MKRTYYAVAPDGSVHTRTTERDYTHAVLIRSIPPGSTVTPTWGPVSFCGRLDLATKEAARWIKNHRSPDDVAVVDATLEKPA